MALYVGEWLGPASFCCFPALSFTFSCLCIPSGPSACERPQHCLLGWLLLLELLTRSVSAWNLIYFLTLQETHCAGQNSTSAAIFFLPPNAFLISLSSGTYLFHWEEPCQFQLTLLLWRHQGSFLWRILRMFKIPFAFSLRKTRCYVPTCVIVYLMLLALWRSWDLWLLSFSDLGGGGSANITRHTASPQSLLLGVLRPVHQTLSSGCNNPTLSLDLPDGQPAVHSWSWHLIFPFCVWFTC
jgi:hypothetical protein